MLLPPRVQVPGSLVIIGEPAEYRHVRQALQRRDRQPRKRDQQQRIRDRLGDQDPPGVARWRTRPHSDGRMCGISVEGRSSAQCRNSVRVLVGDLEFTKQGIRLPAGDESCCGQSDRGRMTGATTMLRCL